jgi:hypothetical protein
MHKTGTHIALLGTLLLTGLPASCLAEPAGDDLKGPKNSESTQPISGMISWVNQRANTVWINLGHANAGITVGLKLRVTSHNSPTKDYVGLIEVTKILDTHLSEARILESRVDAPILPGDLVTGGPVKATAKQADEPTGKAARQTIAALREEVAKLRKEVRQLQLERDRLFTKVVQLTDALHELQTELAKLKAK